MLNNPCESGSVVAMAALGTLRSGTETAEKVNQLENMFLLMIAAVLFAWGENLDWRIHQPEYGCEIQSLNTKRKILVCIAWGIVGLVALSFLLRLARIA